MAETPSNDLRGALAEALEESQFPTTETEVEDSWEGWDAEEEPASAAGNGPEPSTGNEEPAGEEPEAPQGTGELPTEYFGVNLEGIPEEQRATILAALQQQDSYIHKLQERMAKEPEAPAAPEAPADPAEVTDEALLQVLGFDPDDYETQTLAPKILPLARTVLQLEETVERLATQDAGREAANQWNTQLDQLEATYGKLPYDRVKVLKYAIDENIVSPFEAYFRIAAPARKEVETAVANARQSAARKAEAGGVKPRSSTADDSGITKDMSLREATRIAMKEAEKETGLSFKSLFGKKVRTD